ncbi:hypothetical protein B0O99DRAFT_589822 [Bisporella sp. PMI_857]|nr:hypothetical protein B0O99DRAFT_589822 [Bisporella sp. PMI_857]
MTPANDEEEITVLERNLVKLGYLPGYLPVDEKLPLTALEAPRNSKMPSIRKFLFTLAIMAVLTATMVCGMTPRVPRSPSTDDQKKLLAILDSVEPNSLHGLLHEHVDQYKDGVFQEDKAAIAAIHQQDAEIASSLVNLVKKQEGSNNNGTTVPPVTSTEVTTTESTTTVTAPRTPSTTTPQTSTTPTAPPPTQETTPTPPPSTSPPTVISSTSTPQTTSPSVSSRGSTTSGPSTSQNLTIAKPALVFTGARFLNSTSLHSAILNATCQYGSPLGNKPPSLHVSSSLASQTSTWPFPSPVKLNPTTPASIPGKLNSTSPASSTAKGSSTSLVGTAASRNSASPSPWVCNTCINVNVTSSGTLASTPLSSVSGRASLNSRIPASANLTASNPIVPFVPSNPVTNSTSSFPISGPGGSPSLSNLTLSNSTSPNFITPGGSIVTPPRESNLTTTLGLLNSTSSPGSPADSNPSTTLPSSIVSNNDTALPTTTPPPRSSTNTVPPESQSVTSLEIITSTAPNGVPTTITRTTVVPADQADQTAGAAAGKTNTASPSLQRGDARSNHAGMSAIASLVWGTVAWILTNVL